ncbi:hypothetical protein [Quatrionicoccus australiensis]|uniref:hypothetical protein n=1 Tax=Quatrionicoccus australiensis TaxID=138118 RepID=UPI001CFA0C48|nr:hypothetical protein [Quatrionicoccus australiensis]MCB4358477.1 hypothetical protein [Quatrionicoccus australiensis]
MTTLSKEDVVRMAGISGISIGNSESSPYPTNFQLHAFATLVRADLVAENERLTDSNQMYLDRIEYLERKYRCHNEYAKRPILYTDGVDGEQCCRDDLWAVSTAELSAMTDQLTATRTALAAAEADNERLRIALEYKHDSVDALMTWCVKNVDKWDFPQYDGVGYAIEKMRDALSKPRDDSALREMIAGVYEECAKVADLFEEKADALNDSIADDDDANEGRSEYIMGKATASSRIANAIRALAEKAKGE